MSDFKKGDKLLYELTLHYASKSSKQKSKIKEIDCTFICDNAGPTSKVQIGNTIKNVYTKKLRLKNEV